MCIVQCNLLTAFVYCNSWPDVPLPIGYTGFAASGPYELQKSPSLSVISTRLHKNTINIKEILYVSIADCYQFSTARIEMTIKIDSIE